MKYLIQNVEIIDSQSTLHHQRKDILIEDGIISLIQDANSIPVKDYQLISASHLKLSIGWFDMRANFKDPGYEHQETLSSGCQSAMYGGFTEVALLPNTHPVVQSKNEIAYLKSHNAKHLVEIYPIAAVSLDTKCKDLTEMYDLHEAGAIAFSDGEKPVWNSDILVKTLQYLQMFDGLLINKAEDLMLTQFGTMNEGIESVKLGLKGMPALAEEMMIRRDLDFLEYAGGKIHFSMISSWKSVELVREAKKKGLNVSCDIAAHQIAFDDGHLKDFDTNFKVNPPFRSQKDIEALIKGLDDGTIEVVVSDHLPLDEESKNLEFDLAEFGIIGIQTIFPVINTYGSTLSLEKIIEKITCNPRRLLKIPMPRIEEGQMANLTLFDAEKEWVLEKNELQSKSKNTPFLNKKLKGKVIAVFNKKQSHINS